MELLSPFLKGFLFSLSLCCDLGMVNVAMIKAGLEKGFRQAFMLGFGSCFGDLTYLILSLLGVAVIFQIPFIRWVLWIGGTIVLAYLTFQMIKKTVKPDKLELDNDSAASKSDRKYFLWGLGLALSSPSVILWFVVVAGPLLATFEVRESRTLIAFISGFFIAGLLWSAFIAILSGITRKRASVGFVRIVSLVSAAIFLILTVKVFIDGLQSL